MIEGLSEEKKEEIYNYVIDEFRIIKDKRDLYDDRVYEWLRLYNSIPKDTRDGRAIEDWEHNIFVPYIFATVETIKPRAKASIYNDPYYLSVDAVDQAYAPAERKIRDWLLFKLDNMNFKGITSQSIDDAMIYPAAWTKVVTNEKIDGEGNKHNYTNIHRVDYLDIWTDFSRKPKIEWIFHRIESNINKLVIEQSKGHYENVENLFDTTYDIDILDKKSLIESLFLSLGDQGIDRPKEVESAKKRSKVELIEWWGSYDINDDGIDERIVVTIGNRSVGIRIDEYKDDIPFFPVRIGKNSATVYGRTIAQQLELLQEELNDKRSKRADLLDRLLKLMFKARRTATFDWDTLFSAPDNVLLMDDIHNDLDVIRQDPLPASSYKEEDIIKGDAQYTTGANDYNNLGRSGAKNTATGISAILTESATRFRSHVDDIVEDLEPLINYIFYKLKKYSTDEESIRIMDSQAWENITPKDLKGNYRIKVGISNITTPNKELRMQMLINLLNVVGRIEGMINIKEFIKRIMSYADIKNIDSIFTEGTNSVQGKKVLATREAIADAKKKKIAGQVEPIQEIIEGPGLLPPPVAPSVPQSVQDPFLDIVRSIQQ